MAKKRRNHQNSTSPVPTRIEVEKPSITEILGSCDWSSIVNQVQSDPSSTFSRFFAWYFLLNPQPPLGTAIILFFAMGPMKANSYLKEHYKDGLLFKEQAGEITSHILNALISSGVIQPSLLKSFLTK